MICIQIVGYAWISREYVLLKKTRKRDRHSDHISWRTTFGREYVFFTVKFVYDLCNMMTTPNGYTPSESERERDDMSVCERITLESVNGWATT